VDSLRLAGMLVWGMREGIIVEVTAADRVRLEAVVADRNSPQKHVWRARIVLLTAVLSNHAMTSKSSPFFRSLLTRYPRWAACSCLANLAQATMGLVDRNRRWPIINAVGLEQTMVEAADPPVFDWYVKNYGVHVNLFVDHSQSCNSNSALGYLGHQEHLGARARLRRLICEAAKGGQWRRRSSGMGRAVKRRILTTSFQLA
jgi:(2R)-phospho-3-sulfolactate synthase (ComA)